MKKFIITLAVLAAAAVGASAQVAIGGGYLNSTSTKKTVNNAVDAVYDGFYAGASYSIPVAKGFGVAPGLYYSYTSTNNGVSFGESVSLAKKQVQQYISLPVNLYFGAEAMPGLKLSIYGGPTLNYCASFKTTYEAGALGATVEKEIDEFKADSANKPFDILVGGGVALDVADMIRVSCGYNFGLLDRYVNENGDDGITATRRGLNVGIAFLF